MKALAIVILLGGVAQARPIVVVAGGDLQLGDPAEDPLARVAPLFTGDLRFVNLEGPLTKKSDARVLAGRIEVVSLANNHALDRGLAGRDETARALADRGIAAAFSGHDAQLTVAGRAVTVIARAFLPAADLDREREVVDAVRAARTRGLVVVSLHWGHTGSLLPTPAERRLAARLVHAGASAVIGHGPHTPQGIERLGGAIIAYSLGNLAFACHCTEETDAYLLRFSLDDAGRAQEISLHPIAAGILTPARLSRDPELARLLVDLSRDLGTRLHPGADALAAE